MGAAIVVERKETAPSWSQVDEFTTSLQVKIVVFNYSSKKFRVGLEGRFRGICKVAVSVGDCSTATNRHWLIDTYHKCDVY